MVMINYNNNENDNNNNNVNNNNNNINNNNNDTNNNNDIKASDTNNNDTNDNDTNCNNEIPQFNISICRHTHTPCNVLEWWDCNGPQTLTHGIARSLIYANIFYPNYRFKCRLIIILSPRLSPWWYFRLVLFILLPFFYSYFFHTFSN